MKKKETGVTKHPLYETWRSMRARCALGTHISFSAYGGRGITVCDSWSIIDGEGTGFFNFLRDMGDKPSPDHTLERKDNDGPYSPENCCWATWDVQRSNKRNIRPPSPGETNPTAKLTNLEASEIGWLYGCGARVVDIVKAYGISRTQVYKIINGQTYKPVGEQRSSA